MTFPIITRQQLEIINRKTLKYPLQIAEKDYFLTVVMQIISGSFRGETLVFKGGTAIHHCYLDQQRFSEDLDFSSNRVKITLDEVRDIFADIPSLTIRKDYLSNATVKIEKLQYLGPLIQPGSVKVEIDTLQNVLLPSKLMRYNNVWGIDFTVRVMDIREICAEKIRAMSDRARYRDFYDLFLLIEKYGIDMNEVISFVGRKEIRKLITKTNILSNWKIVITQKVADMNQIYYSQNVHDEQIEKMIRGLAFTKIISSH